MQFLKHWRRLNPEAWFAARAALLRGVLASMPRAIHEESTLQVCDNLGPCPLQRALDVSMLSRIQQHKAS